jgi:hypothetical protein
MSFGQTMTINAYDAQTNPALKPGDTYEASWVVFQYNTAHTAIIQTWQGYSQLNPPLHIWTWQAILGNPWSEPNISFTISSPLLPLIYTQDFRVLLGVKRSAGGTIVAGDQRYSGWMNTSQLTGSFSITLYIQ